MAKDKKVPVRALLSFLEFDIMMSQDLAGGSIAAFRLEGEFDCKVLGLKPVLRRQSRSFTQL